MKTIHRIIFALLCICFLVPAWSAEQVVAVKGIPPTGEVKAGAVAIVTVELDILAQYHINSNQPLEDYLKPTRVELEPVSDLKLGKILYPAAEEKAFPLMDTTLSVFEGTVKIGVEVTPGPALKGKKVVLKGKVWYQACNDSTCLPEESQSFTVRFPVSDDDSGQPDSGSSASGTTGAMPPLQTDAPVGSFYTRDIGNRSFPITLILVFLGGLALNLTPCVYPMIPITISYFGGQAQGKKGSIIAHAILYIVGMSVTYSVLGVAAALTGGLLGTALQYPPVLVGISLVMVFLALSMFDVYEIRMPAFLNRLAGGNRTGFAGTFLMGLTVGIVAAPCIGPFVFGLLTYVGNRGNALLGFLLFFILSLGLGIPLLVLGIFSGSIRRLPRSGEWMVWVRKVFGFILLAMAVFFLRTIFPHPLIYPLSLAMILSLAGIYLAWIAPVAGGGRGFAWIRNLVGIGFFAAALFMAITGLESYLESYSNFRGAEAVEWQPYSEQMMEQAHGKETPVIIDFYADWCAPCKELDRNTFTDPDVVVLAKQFTTLKVDMTETSPEGEALSEKYGILGMPTVLFLKPDGSEIEYLRVTGFQPAEVFLPKMKEAYRISENGK